MSRWLAKSEDIILNTNSLDKEINHSKYYDKGLNQTKAHNNCVKNCEIYIETSITREIALFHFIMVKIGCFDHIVVKLKQPEITNIQQIVKDDRHIQVSGKIASTSIAALSPVSVEFEQIKLKHSLLLILAQHDKEIHDNTRVEHGHLV